MTATALQQTTRALQLLIHDAINPAAFPTPDATCSVGPLDISATNTTPVSLFLFHIEPNREMRNEPRLTGAGTRHDALAVELRYVISVNRAAGSTGTEDLARMGQIIAKLQANPTIGEPLVPDQLIRLTPEPYPMEEMSRVWGLYGTAPYRTSIVYLASPVFVDAVDLGIAERVSSRRLDVGQSAEPPVFRRVGT